VSSSDGDAATGKQIVYAPEHLLNAGIRTGYKNFYFSWISCYTSKRFTSADNTEDIPGYLLNNLSVGIKLGSGKNTFDLNIKADNVFNANYQAIAWFPMPGRSFLFSIIYKFSRQNE
jgi:vitamin B12 transporter